MYIDKDAFSTAEKVNICPTNESYKILDSVDLSASEYEIHRQLCRQGRDIRNAYFRWICRKVFRSITNLFQTIDEEFARFREYQEKKEMWFGNTELLTPKHIKDQIRSGG